MLDTKLRLAAALGLLLAAPSLAQTGRAVQTTAPLQVGRTATFEVSFPANAAQHAGWFAVSPHFPGTTNLQIPGFTSRGLVRVDATRIVLFEPWTRGATGLATMRLPVPDDSSLVGAAIDVQSLDVDAAGTTLWWSDNDLELVVDPTGCGSTLTITPLYPNGTPLEPDVVVDTPTAKITYLADRARDRHAREDIVNGIPFRAYDHWLSFYWEQRIAELEIIDRVAKGGSTITFRFMTHDRLNPAEFRTFFAGGFAVYHNNLSTSPGTGVTLLSTTPSTRYPGETEYLYEATLTQKIPEYRPLQIGDRIEVELSQFLAAPRNGRSNYYGTAFLYVVGVGVEPWYAKHKEEATTPQQRDQASFDSYPVPAVARLGGQTTLPYQYSNEPEHRFKQTAGNISPTSGHEFVLGRRLHHTDFEDGSHSEAGNPPLSAHVGQLGPKFINRSCVDCHVNNGRSLPPAVGETLTRAVVRVAADRDGTPHPSLGEVLQPSPGRGGSGSPVDVTIQAESYLAMSGVLTEPTNDVGGGLHVTSIDTGDWMSFADQPVAIPADGIYRVEVRVASAGGGTLAFEESGGNPLHGRILIPSTGGDLVWQTVTTDLWLPAGSRAIGMNAFVGGWKLNWFRVRSLPSGGGGGGGGGANSEGVVRLAGWDLLPGSYGDGQPFELRRPRYAFEGVAEPEFFAVHSAPPLVGLGLLEAIDEATILLRHDPCDANGDGISGRASTTQALLSGQPKLGRFTWKGGRASVHDQIAAALNRDMGVATLAMPVLDGDTTPTAPEVSTLELDRMTRYTALLGVGARRALTDADALRGEQLFSSIGCASCHLPEISTGAGHPYAELRNQTIRPFTDLLLHDLGPDLADRMGTGDATGAEWRTAPLWNIGLTAGVSGGEAYLHDGRARSLEEAILWHGGEGQTAKEAFRTLPATDRAALVAFLRSL